MRKTLRSMRIASACTLVIGLGVLGATLAQAVKENPANDCLVGIEDSDSQVITTDQSCTDGDSCDADGATNGVCVFRIKGCVNLVEAGCTQRPIKKVRFVAPHSKDKVSLTPISGSTSSACGAFVDFHVALKKKGKKPAKAMTRKINASATADVKPAGKNKDSDKIKFTCNPCPTDNCVPPTTTSTTTVTSTSTSTSTTIPTCGDGVVNGSEACDPAAATTGCGGGETCMPPGSISECTCKTCTPINPVKTMRFTTSTATTDNCGPAGLTSPPDPPTTGSITTDTNAMIALGAGCLYIGGGGSQVPGGVTPDNSESDFDLTLDCGGEIVIAAQTGSSLTCTKGAGPGKACINDLSTWPTLTSCTTDADCPHTGAGNPPTVAEGSCVDKPNCLFGPPLTIENGPLSTCVVNTIGSDASGSLMPASSTQAQVTLPLRSHTFLRAPGDTFPCPQCISNVCSSGPNMGNACETTSVTAQTSIDCPPPAAGGGYLPEFKVNLEKLTTGTSSKSDAGGIFCPDQNTFSAFGTQNRTVRPDGDPNHPPIKVVNITETGSPAASDLSDNLPHDATLAAVFCIPATGNAIIDGAADLAGPGATSLPGTIQILP